MIVEGEFWFSVEVFVLMIGLMEIFWGGLVVGFLIKWLEEERLGMFIVVFFCLDWLDEKN